MSENPFIDLLNRIADGLAGIARQVCRVIQEPDVQPIPDPGRAVQNGRQVVSQFQPSPDQLVLARTMWGEARSDGRRGMQAVANVIMNRVKLARLGVTWWGHSVQTVALADFQFSAWNANDPNRQKMLAVNQSDRQFQIALDLAGQAINGQLPDITNGADHYKVRGHFASWAVNRQPVAVIGGHEFYRLEKPGVLI